MEEEAKDRVPQPLSTVVDQSPSLDLKGDHSPTSATETEVPTLPDIHSPTHYSETATVVGLPKNGAGDVPARSPTYGKMGEKNIGNGNQDDDEDEDEDSSSASDDGRAGERKLRDLSDGEVHEFPGVKREKWWWVLTSPL